MKKVVYKYELGLGKTELKIPAGGIIIDLAIQNNVPYIWVLCNPDAEPETRRFESFGTGHAIENADNKFHIGSVHFQTISPLVFHFFEIR